ncbi:MAG: glutathione peroxidase [Methylococcales bacterium]|nr:glutathione peroxidase [Methylococcales bacterium]
MTNIYTFSAKNLDGQTVNLDIYRNQVLLIVNTASACGFTPQYRELETLYRTYRNQGFAVLGFPCNQFGGQEPGDHETIAEFCRSHYQISFPIFAKIEVNGENTHPLYRYLKSAAPGAFGTTGVKWNFSKFLVGRDGGVYKRYGSLTPPTAISGDIETLLKA